VPFTRKIPGIRSKTHKRAKFRRWSLSSNCFSQLAVSKTLKRMRKNIKLNTWTENLYILHPLRMPLGSGKNVLSERWRAKAIRAI